MHELFHVLALTHAKNAPKRDKFIKILWENINYTKVKKLNIFTYSSDFSLLGLRFENTEHGAVMVSLEISSVAYT